MAATRDGGKGTRRKASRPRPAAKDDPGQTYIIGLDGKRYRTQDYGKAKAEATFIIGHDGKRYRTDDYRNTPEHQGKGES